MVMGHGYGLQPFVSPSMEALIDRLPETSTSPDAVNLIQWFSGVFEEGWQAVEDPNLAAAYQQVLKANKPVELEQKLAFKLHCLGLVSWQDSAVVSSCQLYTNYFRDLSVC